MKRLRTPFAAACIAIAAAPGALVASAPAALAAATPAILTTKSNTVPACVTPARLMQMLEKRNTTLLPKLKGIAVLYKKHGEELHLRWDYAFYQMLVETNYLKFYAPGGKPGDVSPGQNNFAGLGATGKRAPGESFASVDSGVLAHLHHVRLYSGDPVENPVAERTKLVTDLILPWAQSLKRPVTFTDLTRKWAPVGHRYSDAIEGTADNYRKAYCTGAAVEEAVAEPAAEVVAEAAPAAKLKAKAKVIMIKPPVVEAPAAKVAAVEPVAEPPAAEVAITEAPAVDDEVTLSGPALKKVAAVVAPAKPVVAAVEPEAAPAASEEATPVVAVEESAAPAMPVAKLAAVKAQPAVEAVAADDEAVAAATAAPAKIKAVTVNKAVDAKLPVAATVTAPSPDADLAAATAKLDGLDTAAAEPAPAAVEPEVAATETAAANEGDGGAVEVTKEQVDATAKPAKKAVAAVTEAAPVVKAKVAAKVVATAEPAADTTSDAVATADSSAEDAAGNTHLASLTVPANPAQAKSCKVFTASYGGGMSLLIQSPDGDRTKFTALTVNEAKADAQAKAFINVYAKGGQKIAQFGTQNEALTKAFELCPEG